MPDVTLASKPRRSDDIVFQSMPPDTILLHLETGFYYSTNRLGAEVWQQCDGDTEVSKIVESLYQTFDASREQLTEDVLGFVRQMADEGLLKVGGNA